MTQQSGQTVDREVKINHFIVLGSGNTALIRLACFLPTIHDFRPSRIGMFQANSLARHVQHLAYDWSVGAMDKMYPIELV